MDRGTAVNFSAAHTADVSNLLYLNWSNLKLRLGTEEDNVIEYINSWVVFFTVNPEK